MRHPKRPSVLLRPAWKPHACVALQPARLQAEPDAQVSVFEDCKGDGDDDADADAVAPPPSSVLSGTGLGSPPPPPSPVALSVVFPVWCDGGSDVEEIEVGQDLV